MLDTLHNTSTGLDKVPAWFLQLGAPVFCKPVALLYNESISTSVVPRQWKSASIRPVPKNSAPVQHSDFRPISITPVLRRTLERVVVRTFQYPAILMPHLVQLSTLATNLHFVQRAQLLQLSLLCCKPSVTCCIQIHIYIRCGHGTRFQQSFLTPFARQTSLGR